jgi:hypothetical protein
MQSKLWSKNLRVEFQFPPSPFFVGQPLGVALVRRPAVSFSPLLIISCRLFAFSTSVRLSSAWIARIRLTTSLAGAWNGLSTAAEARGGREKEEESGERQQSGQSQSPDGTLSRGGCKHCICHGLLQELQSRTSQSGGTSLHTIQRPSVSQGKSVILNRLLRQLSLSRFQSSHLQRLGLSLTAAFSKSMRLLESFVASNFSRSLGTSCIYLLPLVHFSLNLKATDISEQNCATQATDHVKLRVFWRKK